MKKFLSIIFCIGIILCLASCQNPNGNTENTEENSASNESTYVQDLNLEIKKNPKEYNGKQITIKGYALYYLSELYLSDLCANGVADRYEISQNTKSKVEIVIADEVLLTVLETGDYIELTGTVTISDGKVYLDNCTYTMITAYEEKQ